MRGPIIFISYYSYGVFVNFSRPNVALKLFGVRIAYEEVVE